MDIQPVSTNPLPEDQAERETEIRERRVKAREQHLESLKASIVMQLGVKRVFVKFDEGRGFYRAWTDEPTFDQSANRAEWSTDVGALRRLRNRTTPMIMDARRPSAPPANLESVQLLDALASRHNQRRKGPRNILAWSLALAALWIVGREIVMRALFTDRPVVAPVVTQPDPSPPQPATTATITLGADDRSPDTSRESRRRQVPSTRAER